jgi:hypothetical protein
MSLINFISCCYSKVSPLCTQRELLASKVLQIGRSLLIGEGRAKDPKIEARAEEAVKWLQKAFSLAEHLDDNLTAGAVDLKVGFLFLADNVTDSGRLRSQRCILRNLGSPCPILRPCFVFDDSLFPARAYVLSSNLNAENLARAETALNELLDSIPPEHVSVHQNPTGLVLSKTLP